MTKLAIIGGSGLSLLDEMERTDEKSMTTPYGDPSADLIFGLHAGSDIIYLARHGLPHTIPPHKINYRANIWALKECGVDKVIAINAVGGITAEMTPRRIIIPDQVIDYTWGREHTFSDNVNYPLQHIDFTQPYTETLRQTVITTARANDIDCYDGGTYAATQGPRLESAAEILRLEKDGCDIVGMTGMPEAALARELDMAYVSLSLVVNEAAGKSKQEITMEMIESNMQICTSQLHFLLKYLLPKLI